MNRHAIRIFLLLATCSLATPAMAADPVEMNSVAFPERKEVELEYLRGAGAPEATVFSQVNYRNGQARIELWYRDMKPAILFGGDVTCYVLWAVGLDGKTENLGEVLVPEDASSMIFSTGQKNFALFITAEPYYLVGHPSEMVMFRNAPAADKRIQNNPFAFDGFGPAPRHAMDSIAQIRWDSRTPLELLQARKAYELAGRRDAKIHAPRPYEEAGAALEAANGIEKKSPTSRKLLDEARRSVALSNVAINLATHRLESIEIEKRIAERRAEMESLEARAVAAEESAQLAQQQEAAALEEIRLTRKDLRNLTQQTEALAGEKAALETSLVAIRAEKATLEKERRQLEQDKADLNTRLQDALSNVAETRNSARGYVLSLPDILFDLNQATLKPQAEVVLAKLAGILLVHPDLAVQIEGHTDSTGTPDYNQVLSEERAGSVLGFLSEESVEPRRLSAVGFGMDQPVAGNDTPEGRKQNRRVEIVISDARDGAGS